VSFTALERETVIILTDADELASVYTAQRSVITRLKKNSAARLIEEGLYGKSPWARFELPKQFISFRSKRRVLSEAERMRRGASLNAARRSARESDFVDPDRRSSNLMRGEGK
jgi:hypothetical protein